MADFKDRDELNQDSLNQDSLNQDSLNQDGLNQDSPNQDGLNRDSLNQDGLNQDELSRETEQLTENSEIVEDSEAYPESETLEALERELEKGVEADLGEDVSELLDERAAALFKKRREQAEKSGTADQNSIRKSGGAKRRRRADRVAVPAWRTEPEASPHAPEDKSELPPEEEISGSYEEETKMPYEEGAPLPDTQREPIAYAQEDDGEGEFPAAAGRGRSRARKNARKMKNTEKTEAAGRMENAGRAEASRAEKVSAEAVSGNEKRRGGKKAALAAGGIAAALLVICAVGYVALGQKYNKVYFPNTEINGIDAAGKTAEEVRQMIAAGIDGYVLTIEARGGETEQIKKEDIDLHAVFDGSLEKILEGQNPNEWLKYRFQPSGYEIEAMIAYDEEAFDRKLNSLDCMNPSLMTKPENAKISEYVENQGYSIVPEVLGNTVIPGTVKKGIADAIINLKDKVSLEEIGGYETPEVTRDDEKLKALLDTMNRYAGVAITYQFGDKTAVLDGSRIHEWLAVNEDGTVSVDSGQAAAFVSELAAEYNTSNKAKTFKTSYGPTITVSGGTYGWRINQAEETAALTEIIASGESQTREPVYAQKAASHGANDYGDTYVEINLTAQHLFFYKDGAKVVESDFVSGNLSRGWGTPAGTYPLNYKQRNAVLKGENYRTPVDYWMPFNGGIGMHDATWRSTFGGTIYKTGGSHGCINLPHSVAKKIYENISSGIPVICYNLSGTEQSGSSAAQTPETAPPTEAVPEVPAENPAEQPVSPGQPAGPAPTEPVSTEPAGPAPAEPAGPAPEQPAPQPETTAPAGPAGPGSDTGRDNASGPGAA